MPHVARWFSEIAAPVVAANVRELVFALGLVLLAAGAALVYPPAGLIVPGAILVWLAIPPATPKRKPS